MINNEYTERTAIIIRYSSSFSNRYIILTSTNYSELYTSIKYTLTVSSFRKFFICTESPYSIRTIWMQSYRIHATSSRTCFFDSTPISNERICIYKVDAKIIVSATPIVISFTYTSDRGIFLDRSDNTQRYITLCFSTHSEKYMFIERLQKTYIFSTNTYLQLSYITERTVYLQLQQTYDMRYIGLLYTVYSDTVVLCTTVKSATIHTLETTLSLANIHSNRYISIKVENTYSNRYIALLLVPCTERRAIFALTALSERSIYISIYSTHALYTTTIVQAIPEKSERVCMYKVVFYISNRSIYVEMRDIYVTKNLLSLNSTSPIVLSNTVHNVSMISDRELIIYSDDITRHENYADTNLNRLVFETANNSYALSLLDNAGVSVGVDNEVRKKILISANIFYLSIILI